MVHDLSIKFKQPNPVIKNFLNNLNILLRRTQAFDTIDTNASYLFNSDETPEYNNLKKNSHSISFVQQQQLLSPGPGIKNNQAIFGQTTALKLPGKI